MMTGVCGALGMEGPSADDLRREFTAIWDAAACETWSSGFLSVYPETPGIQRHSGRKDWLVAGDGETSVLDRLLGYAQWADGAHARGSSPSVPPDWRGNGIMVKSDGTFAHLATEWTGTFPLYFCRTHPGFAFSSHLRPLARALGASRDYLGAVEFLRHGYILNGRTPFKRITRLLPGQSLTFSVREDQSYIEEHSNLWARPVRPKPSDVAEITEELWRRLRQATSRSLPARGLFGLMLSGGWDSRTLLALLRDLLPTSKILCYCHGDTRSREHELVRQMASRAGVGCQLREIDGSVWDPGVLKARFSKTENVAFPGWHAAGRWLSESEVRSLTAGLYGPTIGGHYGEPSVRTGVGQMLSLADRLRKHYVARLRERPFDTGQAAGKEEALQLLRIESVGSHWYLAEDVDHSFADLKGLINADIEASLGRLDERGVVGMDAMIEAFRSESRSSQFTNAQLLSCRPDVDVVFPFIDRRVLKLATQLPLALKINNYLNQRLVGRVAPELLEYPMAATLVDASRPIWLQELSRLVRRGLEDWQWWYYMRSAGSSSVPAWGWVGFEFLRDGEAFRRIRLDLEADIWDRNSMERLEAKITSFSYKKRLHPVYDQMSKIYTLDLLYR